MASMYGIQIKGLKKFKGHDSEDVFQGNVYKDGKLLGFWSQSSHGGPDSYNFNENELRDALIKYIKKAEIDNEKLPDPFPADLIDTDIFMYELVNLMECEKVYKREQKKGFNVLTIIEDTAWVRSTAPLPEAEIEARKSDFPPAFARGKVQVFASPNNFIIQ